MEVEVTLPNILSLKVTSAESEVPVMLDIDISDNCEVKLDKINWESSTESSVSLDVINTMLNKLIPNCHCIPFVIYFLIKNLKQTDENINPLSSSNVKTESIPMEDELSIGVYTLIIQAEAEVPVSRKLVITSFL